MELIRGLHNLRTQHVGCVASIGNFDGVHVGHQAVLRQLADVAAQQNLPMTVIVFEPQPLEYFQGANAPARLTRFSEKLRLLQNCGVDRVLCVRFDEQLAQLSAEDFVRQVLVEQLGVRFLVVGDDFRFGRARSGDFALLQSLAQQHHFAVASTESWCVAQERVSSTAIRNHLAAGEFTIVAQLLGRPFSLTGRVVHGDKRGRTIGVPTANVRLFRQVVPVNGVFAVEAQLDGHSVFGVANVGKRPTVSGKVAQLEAHFFDYNGDLYGRRIEVILRCKLRDEQQFASFEQLAAQISRDIADAKYYFYQSA